MNSVEISGPLGADPDLKMSENGSTYCLLTVGVQRYVGRGKTRTDWIPVIVWHNKGEAAARHLRKGRRVWVHGILETMHRESGGRKMKYVHVRAESVEWDPRASGQPEEPTTGEDDGSQE